MAAVGVGPPPPRRRPADRGGGGGVCVSSMGVAVGEPPAGAAAAEGGGGGERKGRFAWWCWNWRPSGSSYYQSDAEANVEHFFIALDSQHGRVNIFERIMVEY